LVTKKSNEDKGNVYPISQSIREERMSFWKMLLEKGLIGQKKFDRLTRSTPLTDDELSAFINRQLVETRQSTKAIAQLLDKRYETEVVYGGYLSFATKKDAEKALKQLKGKDGFALLDKFVSTKSITTDEHGEESATTPTLDFALKKDAVTEENVKNWLFGDRKAYDVDIVESKDGKSFYLVIYVSKEGASLRTARTAWIDEALTAHVDALVKDGGYTFNEEALAKVEDVVTTTTK
jgi:hypothetical protein